MQEITTEDLIAYYHIKSWTDNNAVATEVIKSFEDLINIKFHFPHHALTQEKELQLSQQISQFLALRDAFVYTSPHIENFFLLLEKYNYKMKHEIKDAIKKLTALENPCHNKDLIHQLLASPAIDDIHFNGVDSFTIFSEMYGSFSFLLATTYFRNNSNILSYLNKVNLQNHCHHHAEKLSKVFPKYKSITSLCTNYFLSYYYHSYSYNPDEFKVIDLCSKSIMDIEEYNCLFEAKEISVVDNYYIKDYYKQALKYSTQPRRRNKIFKIVLYNHLKNMDKEEKRFIKSYKQSL